MSREPHHIAQFGAGFCLGLLVAAWAIDTGARSALRSRPLNLSPTHDNRPSPPRLPGAPTP